MSVVVEVVDCTFGQAAEGIPVALLREVDGAWQQEVATRTDQVGRVPDLGTATARGRYRLLFDLDGYFPTLGVEPFQSRLDVTFRIFQASEQVHFLLMVTPTSSSFCRLSTTP